MSSIINVKMKENRMIPYDMCVLRIDEIDVKIRITAMFYLVRQDSIRNSFSLHQERRKN